MILLILLMGFGLVKGQSDKPDTYFDIGLGAGPNYGIFGVKTVTGFKGSGLILSIGSFDGYNTASFGFQLSLSWVYLSYVRGAYGSYFVEVNGSTYAEGLLEGNIITLGVNPSLTKNKRLFLDIGVGHAGGDSSPNPLGGEIEEGGVSLAFGLGYKI